MVLMKANKQLTLCKLLHVNKTLLTKKIEIENTICFSSIAFHIKQICKKMISTIYHIIILNKLLMINIKKNQTILP